jgi:hypothetical protein
MLTPADRNPKVIFTLLFVFLAGAAVGALSMSFGLHDRLHGAAAANGRTAPPTAPNANREAVLKRFQSELDLSPEQTTQIAVVLDDYRNYFESLREQLDDVRSSGKTRILEILNPDQREKFAKIANEWVPGPPPPPPAR